MTFHLLAAYGIAGAAALFLVFAGVRNYHSGWRRDRSNTLLDVLLASAEAKAELRNMPLQGTPVPQPRTVPQSLAVTDELFALQSAVGVTTGEAPITSSPVLVLEEEKKDLSATRV